MTLHEFLKTRFIYAKRYLINITNIKKIMYEDNDKGTVYQGAQAHNYNMKKSGPSIGIYDWLSEEIYKYLTNKSTETQGSFDKWHDKICNEFLNKCRSAGFCQLGTKAPVEYGLAQKFLNIAMKYIYCFDDADEFDEYKKFDFCHIALDSYTFCPKSASRTCKQYTNYSKTIHFSGMALRTPFYAENVNPRISVKSLKPWSRLTRCEYIRVKEEVRSYFSTHPVFYSHLACYTIGLGVSCLPTTHLTPFQVEFFIW